MNIITSSFSTALLALTLATASAQVNPTHVPDFFETTADKPVTVTLHQNNDHAKVTIPNGAIVKVILESQAASTGFDWSSTFSSPGILTFGNKSIKKTSIHLIGAPCHEVWIFKATVPGQTFLNFSLVRPWEKEVAPVQAVQFDVTVQ